MQQTPFTPLQPLTPTVAPAPAAVTPLAGASCPPLTQQQLQDKLQPVLEILEKERKNSQSALVNAMLYVVPLAGVAAIAALVYSRSGVAALVPVILACFVVGIVYNAKRQSYRNQYKSLLVENVVKAVNPGLSYSPKGFISEWDFRGSHLFRNPDRYRGEDCVSGVVGSTQMTFSQVHAEYRTRDSKGREYWHTIFRGVFFIADFNKNFNGLTTIRPDTAEKLLGKFGQTLQAMGTAFSNQELVKLEDPDFEREFVVCSTDQIEARYILSPALMRRLLELRQRYRSEIHVAFTANRICLALSIDTDLFEPPSFGQIVDSAVIARCLDELQSILCIVEELNLNTRIWSKS